MFGSAILLATVLWSAEGGGNVAAKLGTQVPFSAAEGFVVEARMNCSGDPRHPCGLSLVPSGEGPVIALGEPVDGLDIVITDITGGQSRVLARRLLSVPDASDRRRLRCRLGLDVRRQVIWCVLGDDEANRVELPAPASMRKESYRIVPSQVPSELSLKSLN